MISLEGRFLNFFSSVSRSLAHILRSKFCFSLNDHKELDSISFNDDCRLNINYVVSDPVLKRLIVDAGVVLYLRFYCKQKILKIMLRYFMMSLMLTFTFLKLWSPFDVKSTKFFFMIEMALLMADISKQPRF